MQQVSNILLGNSTKTASSFNENATQDADNNSFLSAFNEASQADAKKVNTDKTETFTQTSLTKDNIDEADVDLIFAQIDLAENFEGNKDTGEDGKVLPLPIQANEGDVTLEGQNKHLDNKLVLDHQLPIVDASLADADVNSDNSNTLNMSVSELLGSLSSEQLGALSAFSSMNETELSLLSPGQLNQLITDFNQQPSLESSIVIQPGAAIETMTLQSPLSTNQIELNSQTNSVQTTSTEASSTQASSNQNTYVQATNIQNSSNASIQQNELSKSADGLNQSTLDKLNAVVTNSVVTNELTIKAVATNAAVSNVAADKTLGDADSVEGKINPKDPAVNLAKAELSVSLDKTVNMNGNNNPVSSASANSSALSQISPPLSTSELTAELEPIDLKSIQNQSSLTSPHKSDVPQFQLSLRQGAESVVQMQEMIQKFAPVMKQQLITMVGQGIQQAEIRLDPAELGHMVVRVQVNGDQTQVQFQVAQSQTRDLIEQAIPRLREMLAEEGMQLADSHVSQDGERHQGSEYDESKSSDETLLDELSAQELELTTKHAMSSNSAIDYYA
ncbi:flagellar hook-length control protein FliK [Shewanella donghaensis]|uniref:flagellar hook-length control protein FliK n=1 Tax=Shewanella donghaensis TaxID=238836 RepID=UPI001182AAA2|nr:flagellar hook-length control protein FliK [Shewanella donghaensis]